MAFTIIFIFLLIFFVRIFNIKLLEPAGIYTFLWLFFIIGSLLFLNGRYIFMYYGIYWILFTCFMSIIISAIFKPRILTNNSIARTRHYVAIPWRLLALFIMLGLCSVVYTMIKMGVNLSVFSDFTSLQTTAHMSAVNRYSEASESVSFLGQILGSFVYIAPICSGYSCLYAKSNYEKLLCLSSILPSLLSMLLTSAKLSLIAFVLLFFVGFYISYIFKNGKIPHLNFKTVLPILFFVGIFYGLIYLSFVLRIGNENNILKVILDKLMIYTFGHVQGFDIWFTENALKIDKYGIWKNSFLSISSKLGLAERNQGVYLLIPGVCTNVYTQFRGLIEDLGPIFSLIILFLIFIFVYSIFSKLILAKKYYVLKQTVLAASLFWLFYFIISAWTYTTYILTFLVFGVFLYISFNVKFVWRDK